MPTLPFEKNRSGKGYFRGDIEGLRGIAIALVLIFHAKIPGFHGGFVGVDVFFVLSGFLITGLLLREIEHTGRISLANFYARRIRRLVPTAIVVLVATLIASYFLLPQIMLPGIATDTASAALYFSNMNFALHATDYFATVSIPSPVLHYWSLSVEEQFYLFWPAIFFLVARRSKRPRLRVGITIALLGFASFVFAVWLLRSNQPWAFFSLPSRAWELALGGAIAASAKSLKRISPNITSLFTWIGIAAVVLSGIYLKESAPFPGFPALIPTIGAGLIIVGGIRSVTSIPARLLSTAPMRFLGRISYSLYLWHWPVLVIPIAIAKAPLTLLQRSALALGAIFLAVITQKFIEDPFRRGRFIGVQPRWNLVTSLLLAGAVAAAALFVNTSVTANAMQGKSTATESQKANKLDALLSRAFPTPILSLNPSPSATRTPSSSPSPTPSPSPRPIAIAPVKPTRPTKTGTTVAPKTSKSVTPSRTTTTTSTSPSAPAPPIVLPSASGMASPPTQSPEVSSTPTDLNSPAPTASLTPTTSAASSSFRPATFDFPLPPDLDPTLLAAKNDRALSYFDGCHTQQNLKASTKPCIYGDLKSHKTVVLFGDSHALSWFPAINKAAKTHNWKLLSLTMSACSPANIPAYNPALGGVMKNCPIWRKATIARIVALHPYAVIIGSSRGFATVDASGKIVTGDGRSALFAVGMKNTIDKIKATTHHVILLQDTPSAGLDPLLCLSTHASSTLACATPLSKALSPSWQSLELGIAKDEAIPTIDPTLWVCPTDPCPVVIGNLLVFSDGGHLSATFSQALAKRMGNAIVAALANS